MKHSNTKQTDGYVAKPKPRLVERGDSNHRELSEKPWPFAVVGLPEKLTGDETANLFDRGQIGPQVLTELSLHKHTQPLLQYRPFEQIWRFGKPFFVIYYYDNVPAEGEHPLNIAGLILVESIQRGPRNLLPQIRKRSLLE